MSLAAAGSGMNPERSLGPALVFLNIIHVNGNAVLGFPEAVKQGARSSV